MTSQEIKKIKSGDYNAQKVLFDKYSDKLMFTLRRYIALPEDQEELLHDVFIKVFTKIETFDSNKASFDTWINRICVNTAINFLKKKKMLSVNIEDILNMKPIMNQAISNINVEHLNSIIESLDDKHKVVFKLKVLDGYEYHEISELLNLKNSNVRKLFSRSKTKLQQLLNRNVPAVINTNY